MKIWIGTPVITSFIFEERRGKELSREEARRVRTYVSRLGSLGAKRTEQRRSGAFPWTEKKTPTQPSPNGACEKPTG